MTRLILVFDATTLIVLAIVFITQLILPLWLGLKPFWLLSKAGRTEVDRRFGYLIGRKPRNPQNENTQRPL